MRAIAVFDSPESVRHAIEAGARAGWRATSLCSPAFNEDLLQLVGAVTSPVPAWTLAGGIAGAVFGLVLTIGTVRQWPRLIVSGKPLVAIPSFLVIVFELAILGASIAAMVAFVVASRRARRAAGIACSPVTTDDRFAVLFESAAADSDAARLLNSMTPREWRIL